MPLERGTFRYIQWQDLYRTEKPFQILIDLPEADKDHRRTNLVFSDGETEDVVDVRGNLDNFSLDIYGFTYRNHSSTMQPFDFGDKNKIEACYLPECESVIREVLDGVTKVHFYNWLVGFMALPITLYNA